MSKPKVLLISASKLNIGGVETHLQSLVSILSSEIDFTLYAQCHPDFKLELESFGADVFAWNVKSKFDLNAIAKLREYVLDHKPDIVHIHDARAGFLLRPMFSLMGIPVIYTVHLPPYYYLWESKFSQLKAVLYGLIEKILNGIFTSSVVYMSYSVFKEAIAKRFVSAKKAVFIPTGINLKRYSELSEDELVGLRKKFNVPDGAKIIVNVARHHAEKNVGMVLQVASQLKLKGYDLEFWLVGDGEERESLEELVLDLNLEQSVKLLGFRNDVHDLLAVGDISLLTSRYEGGRSLAIQEAQASGLPCVVSNVGDNSSLVNHRKNGWLFEIDDIDSCIKGLEYILTNEEVKTAWGEAGRIKALSEYDENENHKNLLDLYLSYMDDK